MDISSAAEKIKVPMETESQKKALMRLNLFFCIFILYNIVTQQTKL